MIYLKWSDLLWELCNSILFRIWNLNLNFDLFKMIWSALRALQSHLTAASAVIKIRMCWSMLEIEEAQNIHWKVHAFMNVLASLDVLKGVKISLWTNFTKSVLRELWYFLSSHCHDKMQICIYILFTIFKEDFSLRSVTFHNCAPHRE